MKSMKYNIIFALLYILSCNGEMIEKGINSTQDPRVPEINVRQEGDNIASGSGSYFINNVRNGSTGSEITFTIENTGSADLNLTGASPVTLSGLNAGEFIITQQPDTNVIEPGGFSLFKIAFSPAGIGDRTATVEISSDDYDEGLYTFTLNGKTKPEPGFTTRVRRGVYPFTVTFTSFSLGEVGTYAWDFNGDGIIDSTDVNPTYTFNETGIYTVSLTVSGPGGENFYIKPNCITVINPERHIIDNYFKGKVYAADIDGDLDNDVIGAGVDGISIWINRGGGNPVWAVNIAFPVAVFVTTLDVDNDGDPDIIASSNESGNKRIVWFENLTGDGLSWSAATDIDTTLNYAMEIIVTDIDGDGDNYKDLVALDDSSADIFWFRNDQSGGFEGKRLVNDSLNTPFYQGGYSIFAADMSGSGQVDILTMNSYSGSVDTEYRAGIWHHDGTPLNDPYWPFVLPGNIYTNSGIVIAADLNNDTYNDLIVAPTFEEKISWHMHDGSVGLVFGNELTIDNETPGVYQLIANDFNGDGFTDILAPSRYTESLLWWKHNGDTGNPGFTRYAISNSFPDLSGFTTSIYSADLNSDGKNDIIASSGDVAISWWDLNQDDVWTGHEVDPYSLRTWYSTAADFDGDGDIDVITKSEGELSWRKNNGDGTFGSELLIDSSLNSDIIHIADINNDGQMDLLSTGNLAISDYIYCWLNTGSGSFGSRLQLLNLPDLRLIYPADLDNDNDMDIIIVTRGSLDTYSDISWWENDGSGTFSTSHVIYDQTNAGSPNLLRTVNSITAGDFNNDGFTDIFIADTYLSDGHIVVIKNNGGGSFELPVIVRNDFNVPKFIITAHVNSDSFLDIVSVGTGADKITWWLNNGDGTFSSTKRNISKDLDDPVMVRAADINGDGHTDFVAAVEGSGEVAWWENDGSPESFPYVDHWTKHSIKSGLKTPKSVLPADFDGDGDLDVLISSKFDNTITWWENNVEVYGP